jgi:S-adenosylmethionine decarboxylase
MYRISYTFN